MAQCHNALAVLFQAAVQAGDAPLCPRLPGFLDFFMQWCERAREDFKLGPEVDEQFGQRRFQAGMTQAYRDWRAMARGNRQGLKAAGFKDDPNRGDMEQLRLGLELVPGWAPGRSMKSPRPAVMKVASVEAGSGAPKKAR